jgi:hypothetical protein
MKLLLTISLIIYGIVLPVQAQVDDAGNRKNNVQIEVLPLVSLLGKRGPTFGLRYERLLTHKWSTAVSGTYYNHNGGYSLANRRVTSGSGFQIRPSWVYYLRDKELKDRNFRGFYTGGALTLSRDRVNQVYNLNGQLETRIQSAVLVGPVIGYQQVFVKRLSLGAEITAGSGYTAGRQADDGRKHPRGFGYIYYDAALRVGYVF